MGVDGCVGRRRGWEGLAGLRGEKFESERQPCSTYINQEQGAADCVDPSRNMDGEAIVASILRRRPPAEDGNKCCCVAYFYHLFCCFINGDLIEPAVERIFLKERILSLQGGIKRPDQNTVTTKREKVP